MKAAEGYGAEYTEKESSMERSLAEGLLFLLGLFIEKQERRGLKRDRRETAVSNETEKISGRMKKKFVRKERKREENKS